MLGDLARPFTYLSIDHPERLPAWVNWRLPSVMAVMLVALPAFLGWRVDVFGDAGLVSKVLGFVQGLTGFYIAALAAIASFDGPTMDKMMAGTPPTVRVVYNGGLERVGLTRRRFLSLMFAFLTALSLVLTLASIGALALAKPMAASLVDVWHAPMKALFCLLYLFGLAQMICVTFWGLFYLGERIHTPG